MTDPVETMTAGAPQRVWDAPVRLSHLLLLLLVPTCWATAEWGYMDWHRRAGLSILGVLVFRLYWGVFGSSTARFTQFVRGPSAILEYLRSLKQPAHAPAVGHNPLGALSVLALLGLLLLQVGTGSFAVDTDGIESGPLSYLVSFSTGRDFAEVHELAFNALLALVLLHIAAVLYYRVFKREPLIEAMVTGRRVLPAGATAGLRFARPLTTVVGVVIAVALAVAVARGFR